MTANKLLHNIHIRNMFQMIKHRNFSCSANLQVKKVEISTDDGVTTVEGKYLQDNNKRLQIKDSEGYCPTCPKKLGFLVEYTDVLIVSQFLKPDGSLLPRHVTGLCETAQYRMKVNAYKAQKAGLIPGAPEPKVDPRDQHSIPAMRSVFNGQRYNIYFNPHEKLPFKVSTGRLFQNKGASTDRALDPTHLVGPTEDTESISTLKVTEGKKSSKIGGLWKGNSFESGDLDFHKDSIIKGKPM